jgi:hypothetical protein
LSGYTTRPQKREIFAGWRREGENSAEHKICDNATIAGVRSQSRCLEETVLANYSTVSVNRRELCLSIPVTQKSEQQNRRRFTSLPFSLSREPSTGYPPPLLKLGSILAIQKFNKQIKREIEKTFLIGCESVSTLLSPCLLDTRKNPPFQFLFFLFTGSGFLRRVIFDFYYLIKKKKGKLPKPLNNLSKLQNFSSTCWTSF